MATLKYIREERESRLLLLGIAEEGESARYTINLEAFEEIGSPSVGDELTDLQMSVIMYTDKLCRARKKALSLLAFADNNQRSLRMKLAKAGFDREISNEVCCEMVELGYINEQRQLQRLILNEANDKLRGPDRIIPALMAKGYSGADIRLVLYSLVESGEVDFKKNAHTLIEKKLPGADPEEKKKLLYKNGYKIC